MLRDYIKLLRVKHYIKNFFVFVPLIFAEKFTDLNSIIKNVLAFFSLCFAASFIYIVNDIKDREKDRLHPVKKNRPIPAGRVSIPTAFIFSLVLIALSLWISFYINFWTLISVLVYVLLNIAYTFGLKNVVILDVMIIAGGFVLRIITGAVAIEVPLSNWIILTAISISLFLGFGKRRHELIYVGENHRKVLQDYSVQFLDYMMIISVTMTVMSYSLYCMDDRVTARLGTDKLILTVPLVIYGLFRYMYLIYKKDEGGDPAELVAKDKGIIIAVLSWFILTMLMIGGVIG